MEVSTGTNSATLVTITIYHMPDGTHVAHTSAPGKIISEPPGGQYVFDVKDYVNNKEELKKLRKDAEKQAAALGIDVFVWR